MVEYAQPEDLLFGDISISPDNQVRWLQAAMDEINQKLGQIFIMPTSLDDPNVDDNAWLVLKRMTILLASGRGMMAQPAAGEDQGVNAYGAYLLREGQDLLCKVFDGEIELLGVTKRSNFTTAGNAPTVVWEDSTSAVDAFYGFAVRGETTQYVPGV